MQTHARLQPGEKRWSAWRFAVESIIFAQHGQVLYAALLRGKVPERGGDWFPVAGAFTIGALVVLCALMERRRRVQDG